MAGLDLGRRTRRMLSGVKAETGDGAQSFLHVSFFHLLLAASQLQVLAQKAASGNSLTGRCAQKSAAKP